MELQNIIAQKQLPIGDIRFIANIPNYNNKEKSRIVIDQSISTARVFNSGTIVYVSGITIDFRLKEVCIPINAFDKRFPKLRHRMLMLPGPQKGYVVSEIALDDGYKMNFGFFEDLSSECIEHFSFDQYFDKLLPALLPLNTNQPK